jgi:adenine-specific DNA-methyltransferase
VGIYHSRTGIDMANILDSLLERVSDPALRSALASEIARLRNTREFGLTFERHIPESVWLPTYPIKRGVKVEKRTSEKSPIWLVTHVNDGVATVLDNEGVEATCAVEELVVVREFGDPVYPGLRSVGRLECGGDKPYHMVINAENYHALEALLYTVQGQVDVLYLDPPYNSGARDWTYNNDYVDASDSYRHSKWLSFMEKRLRLGRGLLKSDAVMVVTIDEHEVTRLGVLLQQLFPEADITLVTIVINPKGVTRPGVHRFSRVEEYAYFCFFGNAGIHSWGDDLLTLGPNDLEKTASSEGNKKRPRWKGLLRSGTNARWQDRKNMFYPLLIDEKRGAVVSAGDSLPFDEAPDFETKINGLTPVWPVRTDGSLGNWGIGPATLRELIDQGYVLLGVHYLILTGETRPDPSWLCAYSVQRPD